MFHCNLLGPVPRCFAGLFQPQQQKQVIIIIIIIIININIINIINIIIIIIITYMYSCCMKFNVQFLLLLHVLVV